MASAKLPSLTKRITETMNLSQVYCKGYYVAIGKTIKKTEDIKSHLKARDQSAIENRDFVLHNLYGKPYLKKPIQPALFDQTFFQTPTVQKLLPIWRSLNPKKSTEIFIADQFEKHYGGQDLITDPLEYFELALKLYNTLQLRDTLNAAISEQKLQGKSSIVYHDNMEWTQIKTHMLREIIMEKTGGKEIQIKTCTAPEAPYPMLHEVQISSDEHMVFTDCHPPKVGILLEDILV